MAVRRLAEQQPESFAFTDENLVWAKAQLEKYPQGRQASAVIPLLMRAQDQDGWVSEPAIRWIADFLGMNHIRVLEVATFYTQFQLQPVGKVAHVQLCGTTPCMLRGSEEIREVCKRRIHHDPFHLSEDGKFSWEEVECLGACVNAPMALIGRDTYEDLTPESFEAVLDAFARGETPEPGPQIARVFSAPAGGPTSLTDLGGAVSKTGGAAAATIAEAPAKTDSMVDAAVEEEVVSDEFKPELLSEAREGGPDDLKMIWGVGPKLEKMLHSMGVFHFDQVAAWTDMNLKWVDQNLEGFKGRAVRDKWIDQAKKLATGWRPGQGHGEKPE